LLEDGNTAMFRNVVPYKNLEYRRRLNKEGYISKLRVMMRYCGVILLR